RLARTLKADMAVAEVAHILRVPGTMNHKYDPPREVRIEVFDLEGRHELEDVEALLPAEAKPVATPSAGRPDVSANADSIEKAAALISMHWPGETKRHTFALALGGWLARQGLDDDSVREVTRSAATFANDEDEVLTGDRSKAASDAAEAV